jgi:hypothetical protein
VTAQRRQAVGVLVVLATLAASPVAAVCAHPGHGTMAIVGALATVSADAVTIDVRDVASGVVTRVRVGVGTDTKLRLKKETLVSLTPWIGASVVATVDFEEGPDGQTTYYATKIQVTPPRKSRVEAGG